MPTEIKGKFLVRELPDLSGLPRKSLERHFLFFSDEVGLCVQTDGSGWILKRKAATGNGSYEVQTWAISQAEFDSLRTHSIASSLRDSYRLSDPPADLRLYHGAHEGLSRAEFSFASPAERDGFQPPSWVGREITGTALANDADLLRLSPAEFQALLAR